MVDMDVCLDPACVGFDTSLADYIAAAKAAGFRLAEVPITWAQEHAVAHGRQATRALLSTSRPAPAQFTCGLGVPGNVCVSQDLFAERLAALAAHADLARFLGVPRASVFCDMSRHEGEPAAAAEVVRRISQIADVLESYGIALSVGLIGRDLLDRAAGMWRAIDRPDVGILVDTVSLAKAGLGADWVETLPAGAIGWLRLADVPPGRPAADLEYRDRLLPGDGTLPLASLVRACQRRGYAGPASVEVGDPRLARLSRAERARRALAATRAVLPAD